MLKYLILLIALLAFPATSRAQTPQDATRDLWDTAFIKKRPAAKTPAARVRPVRYRVVGKSSLPPPNNTAGGPAVVGVTVWRLRPTKTTDEAEVRQLLHQQGEWTPERVGGETPVSEGSKVQLTIESPRTGYLYVFDREMYADKTFGEPYLIFPTLGLNGGDNKVSAGRVIEIPSSDDKPPYYTLKRSRDDHAGEALTVIVSDKPLPDLTIGRGALKVSAEQFDAYEKQWGAMTQQLELDNGAGTAMSKAEKAAATGKEDLTQDDFPPQTIYRVQAKPGQPLLLTIPLSISSKPDRVTPKPGS
ncbi:MAG: DUF4384 domain-containing protein [Acidobacteriota bacterium]|nr:DUF4384 domain-containing protein [Acidobacteriota bacterium]